jgi:hypothetical protein
MSNQKSANSPKVRKGFGTIGDTKKWNGSPWFFNYSSSPQFVLEKFSAANHVQRP